MVPRACYLAIGLLAFTLLYQYSGYVGNRHAQRATERAGSWPKALSVTLPTGVFCSGQSQQIEYLINKPLTLWDIFFLNYYPLILFLKSSKVRKGFPYIVVGKKLGVRKTQVQILVLCIECTVVYTGHVIYLSEPQFSEIAMHIK